MYICSVSTEGSAALLKVSDARCRVLLKPSFRDAGGVFEKSVNASIKRAIQNLKEFSQNFRDPSIIAKHALEITSLLLKIKT